MSTKFTVRVKTKTKLKIFSVLFIVSILIVATAFQFFDQSVPSVKYDSFFAGEVVNPYTVDSVSTTTEIAGNTRFPRTPKYPYEIRIKANDEVYVVGSFKQSFVGDKVCIGRLVDSRSKVTVNYVKVDNKNC